MLIWIYTYKQLKSTPRCAILSIHMTMRSIAYLRTHEYDFIN